MGALVGQLAESGAAFRAVVANPNVRRLELAWAGSVIGSWAYAVAVSVYAYQRGGTAAVGLVFVLRMFPAAVASPFTAALADRYRREWIMLGSDLGRVALIGSAAAAVFVDAPAGIVYGLALLASVVYTPFRPAQAALVPALSRTPNELTAANVVSSTIESLGFFVGPALAGLLLAVGSTQVVFLATAGLILWSAFFVARIRTPSELPAPPGERAGVLAGALAGFKAVGGESHLRILVGLLAAQTFVVGALEVLVVVAAIKLLDIGAAGVGFLNSAFGIGALIGALGAVALVGVRRLAPPFVAGVLLLGAPLALIGVWPETTLAVFLFGLVGAGNTLVDVAGFTLVQRAVPDEVLARVFGVLQMLWLGMIGLGAIVVAPIVTGLGVRPALIVTGAFLPALVALVGPRLIRIDAAAVAPGPELALLRSIPIFAPLPGVPLEQLAGRLVPLLVEGGTPIVTQGELGDRFYVIAEGEMDVVCDGELAATLGPGGYFGEIALLRDVPRTATVTAKTPATLYALERDDFLAAVTSHAPSAAAAETVVAARLSRRAGAEPVAPAALGES